MSETWGTVYQMERDKALGQDAASLRKQLSDIAKALAWEPPYQASLSERATSLMSRLESLQAELTRLQQANAAFEQAIVTVRREIGEWSCDTDSGEGTVNDMLDRLLPALAQSAERT